ncbi:uncharacterized protein [Asterias amurensis]|uniref:uncharacterized protein n=1 Tax=Asterias amurensis TaxID=7602 RepID=UPI003AB64607
MEKENFFTKLRRVATSTVNETASLQTCMERPVAMRTSNSKSNGEVSSAKLVLKEMRFDAQKMKEQVSQQLQDFHSSAESFEEIVDACEGLCDITKQQMEELEGYLEQYGYKKYNGVETQQPKQENKKTKNQEKENVAPEPTSPVAKENSKMSTDSVLCTPPRAQSAAPPVDPNRTPQLADFGISQWTMDRMSNLGLHDANNQDLKMTDFAAPQAPSAIPNYMYPTTTPQHTQKPGMRTPFTNRTILVTPGMFGNQVIPTETPTQFIDTKSYLVDSPIPPVLMSSIKKSIPTTSDLRVSSRRDMEVGSESSVPIKFTAWSEYSSLPAPPFQHLAPSLPAEVTPPMPECLTKPFTQAPMPSEPTRLAEKFTTAPTLPSEPVQLAQKFSINAMPSEPMSLVDKFVHRGDLPQEPKLLRQQFDLESRMTTAPSFGPVAGLPSHPITPKHQRLNTLADKEEMPQTPELTMTYQRFVDVNAYTSGVKSHIPAAPIEGAPQVPSNDPQPPVLQSSYQQDHVQSPLMPRETPNKKSLGYTIPPVTEVEFSQVLPYLQRLIPMEVFNQHLELLNVILAEKQDASFISEVEMQMLQLGKKTKSFTLLLAKLKRLYLGKKPGSTEPVYYIPK